MGHIDRGGNNLTKVIETLPHCPRCGSTDVEILDNTLTVRGREFFEGNDCFSFVVSDGIQDSDIAKINIRIPPTNDIILSPEDITYNYKLRQEHGMEFNHFAQEEETEDVNNLINTIECRVCKYVSLWEEVGWTPWRNFVEITIDKVIYYIFDFTEVNISKGIAIKVLTYVDKKFVANYNKLKKLYTTTNIEELPEFLADTTLAPIAQRRYDELTKGVTDEGKRFG